MKKNFESTIFALSTNYAQSAIAVFRISGSECKKIAKYLCNIKKLKDRYVYYSKILDQNSNLIDKCIIIFFKSPKSYTGEDLLEIHTHGSIAIIKKLTNVLSNIPNTRPALPGEFSKRAFYNGKGNMLYFEGINNLINAETENQRIIANKHVNGENSEICLSWRKRILENLAIIDAHIEFADDIDEINTKTLFSSLKKIKSEIYKVCMKFEDTRNLVYGSKFLIIGPTNAGKSSLFNFLLQNNQMIVSSAKGTTTDQSEQSVEILGQKVIIIDSAGLRNAKRKIEQLGIKKTFDTLNLVHKIIIVLSPDSIETQYIEKVKEVIDKISLKDIVVVFNKLDLKNSKKGFTTWLKKIPKLQKFKSITISCKDNFKNDNMLKMLRKFLHKHLISVDTNSDDYYFSEVRQLKCLQNICEHLEMAIEHINTPELCSQFLRNSMGELDNLFGKHDQEDKLGIIFSNFCIGK